MPTRHTVDVDDDTVVAVHHEADTDNWIFFSHGFLSDKEGSYEGRCERAVAEGYNAVRFDHRGCGESDLSFSEGTLSVRTDDLRDVIDYFSPDSCILFGSSFGGKVVLHTGVGEVGTDIEAIATRAPVTYNGIFEKYRPNDATGESSGHRGIGTDFFEDFEKYGFSDVERRIKVPVAIFHGRDDKTVPLEHSLDAVAGLDTDVSLHVYADEGHNFSRDAEDSLRDTLFDWIKSI